MSNPNLERQMYPSYWVYNPDVHDFVRYNKMNKLRSDQLYYNSFGNTFQELWLFCLGNPREIMAKELLLHYCNRMVKLFSQFPAIGHFCPKQYCIDIFGKNYKYKEYNDSTSNDVIKNIRLQKTMTRRYNRLSVSISEKEFERRKLESQEAIEKKYKIQPLTEIVIIPNEKITHQPFTNKENDKCYYHLPSGLLEDEEESHYYLPSGLLNDFYEFDDLLIMRKNQIKYNKNSSSNEEDKYYTTCVCS